MSQKRDTIIDGIVAKRIRQFDLPGVEFDRINTPADWTTLTGHYLFEEIRRGPFKPSRESFENALVNAAAVIVAALEHCDGMQALGQFEDDPEALSSSISTEVK